jgi:hypothetical protein
MDGNSIIGNVISGNGADLEQPGTVVVSTGIEIFADASSGARAVNGTRIEFNHISNESIDLWVGTNATSLTAHFNDLGAPAVGVQNAGSGSIDARLNFWGCAGGANTAGCATTVGANIQTSPSLPHAI